MNAFKSIIKCIFIVVLYTIVSLDVRADTVKSDIRVTVQWENTTLKEAMKWLGDETGLNIAYPSVIGIKKVSCKSVNERLSNVLDTCLTGTGIKHILKENSLILVLQPKPVPTTNFTVEGIVFSNKDKLPLGLAHVYVVAKGVIIGDITDSKGRFKFKINSKMLPINVKASFTGFKQKNITINDQYDLRQKSLRFNLEKSVFRMEELIVSPSADDEVGNSDSTLLIVENNSKGWLDAQVYMRKNVEKSFSLLDRAFYLRNYDHIGSIEASTVDTLLVPKEYFVGNVANILIEVVKYQYIPAYIDDESYQIRTDPYSGNLTLVRDNPRSEYVLKTLKTNYSTYTAEHTFHIVKGNELRFIIP